MDTWMNTLSLLKYVWEIETINNKINVASGIKLICRVFETDLEAGYVCEHL